MADAIRVCVAGHRGKVGSVLEAAFANEPGIEYVGGISRGDDLATFSGRLPAARLAPPPAMAWPPARRLAPRRKDKPFAHRKAEKETLPGTRGGEEGGVAVHSVRLPGFVADQEVIFGLPGQTLTISHRTTSREAYVPGVLLAIRRVTAEPRFYRALDELLGLGLG